MDFCDYRAPNFPGHSAYQRVHSPRAESSYDSEQEFSLDGLNLSEDKCTEDMFFCAKSSRKQGLRDSNRRGIKTKYQKLNNPPVIPRARRPAIDVALRNLDHELNASLKVFQPLVQCFEADVEPIRGWAENITLDIVWRNKVKEKDAVKDAIVMKEVWEGRHGLERQILTANKAIVFCDGIVGLAGRAASERLACKQLVVELEEARLLLSRKKHAWICRRHEEAEQPREERRGSWNQGNGAEEEDEQGGLFDNPEGQSQEHTSGDQGGYDY
ncbi:uncharacterized protein B0H64DRAFT_369509 [Chaetomium fimeti]|uniref:Uncharacterized protein n=1 Tax=Chaetomium fimeti TaxID=1854472 RepID=A0AAE0LWH3_9PEZI|nr:hypothetical protein B0H64DRAFT_369509 [Chaetomium fimeti]